MTWPAVPISRWPDIPSVGGSQLDIVSMAVGGATSELYLLERGAGLVHVFNRGTGLFQRTIRLPSVLEGGMAFVPGAMTEDDRLLIAANRSDLVVSIPTIDPLAGDPFTADFTVLHVDDMFRVQRDAEALDFEFTGLAYDAATQTAWAVDPMARYGAGSSMLIQFSVADGSKGISLDGVHGYARIVDGGVPSVASAVAFDGTTLHVLRATDPDVTIRVAVDPGTVSLVGADLELPNSIVGLPEVARSIADGKTYLRFQLLVDGDFVDPDHGAGAVTFGDVVIDEVELVTRNVSF